MGNQILENKGKTEIDEHHLQTRHLGPPLERPRRRLDPPSRNLLPPAARNLHQRRETHPYSARQSPPSKHDHRILPHGHNNVPLPNTHDIVYTTPSNDRNIPTISSLHHNRSDGPRVLNLDIRTTFLHFILLDQSDSAGFKFPSQTLPPPLHRFLSFHTHLLPSQHSLPFLALLVLLPRLHSLSRLCAPLFHAAYRTRCLTVHAIR